MISLKDIIVLGKHCGVYPTPDLHHFFSNRALADEERGKNPYELGLEGLTYSSPGFGNILNCAFLGTSWLAHRELYGELDFEETLTEILSHYKVAITQFDGWRKEEHLQELLRCRPEGMKVVLTECANVWEDITKTCPQEAETVASVFSQCDLYLSTVPGSEDIAEDVFGIPSFFEPWALPRELVLEEVLPWEEREGVISCATGLDFADMYAVYIARACDAPLHSFISSPDKFLEFAQQQGNVVYPNVSRFSWSQPHFWEYLGRARVGLCLKLIPTWGRSIIEGAGRGTPFITTASGGSVICPELTVGLNDFKKIVSLARQLLNDKDFFHEMSQKCWCWAVEYTPEKCQARILRLINTYCFGDANEDTTSP